MLYSSTTGRVNIANSFKTLLSAGVKLLSAALTLCLIELELFLLLVVRYGLHVISS